MEFYESNSMRRDQVNGFSKLIMGKINEGWDASYVNFMFNQLPGKPDTKKMIMKQEVERVHGILAQHVTREPKTPKGRLISPIFIGSPDLPVAKYEKELVRNLRVNDGLHFNVVALLPPTRFSSMSAFRYSEGSLISRLNTTLEKHIRTNQLKYLTDRLYRIHVKEVDYGTMADYTLKTFNRRLVCRDDIIAL